jgi:aminoglycoside 3-N-acetyltransferase
MTSRSEIVQSIRNLKLSGHAVCLHASLRSFGWVDGAAQAILDAFLAEGCTALVPTFSWQAFAIYPPPRMRPARNGWNYAVVRDFEGSNRIYTPEATEIDSDMRRVSGWCSGR